MPPPRNHKDAPTPASPSPDAPDADPLAREARCLIAMFGPERRGELLAMLERQFAVLHNRAQVLLGLCGVLITTTGFSGRIIAGTNRLAQWSIILGLAAGLVAAGVSVWGVLRLQWIPQYVEPEFESAVPRILAYRDRKTRAYRHALLWLTLGVGLYVLAIAVMLLFPERDAVPLNR